MALHGWRSTGGDGGNVYELHARSCESDSILHSIILRCLEPCSYISRVRSCVRTTHVRA